MNQGFANTGCNSVLWSVGKYTGPSLPGFGLVTVTEESLTLSAYAADGTPRLSHTIAAR